MFKDAWLYTEKGDYLTSVLVPPMDPPPEIVMWGSRAFVHKGPGQYVETFAIQVFTKAEYEAMSRDGIIT